MGLAQRAEKKVEISKFAQVFPRIFSFFSSYMKRYLLSLNDEGFMQISLHGGGDQKDPLLMVQTQLLPSLGSDFLSSAGSWCVPDVSTGTDTSNSWPLLCIRTR